MDEYQLCYKSNTAECVLLSPEEYIRLMDEVNDARLLATATERIQTYDSKNTISGDTVFRDLGITDEDLEGFEK